MKVLSRGYAVVQDSQGKIIRSIKDTEVGQNLDIQISDGRLDCIVQGKKEEPHEKLSFEAAMDELEEIVHQLESGEISLENSLKLLEKGTKLSSYCYTMLNNAQQKVTELSKLEEAGKEETSNADK